MNKSFLFGVFGAVLLVAVAFYWLGGERAQPDVRLDTPPQAVTETDYAYDDALDVEAVAFARAWERHMGYQPGWYTDQEALWKYEDAYGLAQSESARILNAESCTHVIDVIFNGPSPEFVQFSLAWFAGWTQDIDDATEAVIACDYWS